MAVLTVDLGDRSYPIHVDAGLLKQGELIREFVVSSEVMVVSDETVAPLYLDQLLTVLTGMRVTCQILPCGEDTKSLHTVTQLFDTMLEASRCRIFSNSHNAACAGGFCGWRQDWNQSSAGQEHDWCFPSATLCCCGY